MKIKFIELKIRGENVNNLTINSPMVHSVEYAPLIYYMGIFLYKWFKDTQLGVFEIIRDLVNSWNLAIDSF